ncbi:MAG: hypothetical protein Q9214_001504 [Letrouitia sp. 1 TL-2023]
MVGTNTAQDIVPLQGVEIVSVSDALANENEWPSNRTDESIIKGSFNVATPETETHDELVEKRKEFSYPPLPEPWTISAADDTKRRTGISAAVGGSDMDARTFARARERKSRGEAAQQEAARHHGVLQRLKAWHQWETQHYSSLSAFLLSTIGYPRRPDRPGDSELKQLATFYFPPRSKLESIESLFLHSGPPPRAQWDQVSPSGWPFLEFEVLNLRGRQFLQDQIDAFNMLQDVPGIGDALDKLNFEGDTNDTLQSILAHRASHLGAKVGFWNSAYGDLPRQLVEDANVGFSYLDSNGEHHVPSLDPQMFSRHPVYRDAVLVRNLFRCFHRGDGYLLTMSPHIGINYLDKNVTKNMKEPVTVDSLGQDSSVLEALRQRARLCNPFDKAGMLRPGIESLEWFLVFLVTEFASTPHNLRQGRNAPDIQKAYSTIVSDLKNRRADGFKRNESINLVREYAACIEEISKLQRLIDNKREYLSLLRKDCVELADRYCQDEKAVSDDLNPLQRMPARIDWARRIVDENSKRLPATMSELKSSLDVLFQLRTIEQNELAVIAESNNRAILVFTVVTVVFLPLSFFTSYYGMNLKGVIDTDRGQDYFWTICGTVTATVVAFTIVVGFRTRLYNLVWEERNYSRPDIRRRGLLRR